MVSTGRRTQSAEMPLVASASRVRASSRLRRHRVSSASARLAAAADRGHAAAPAPRPAPRRPRRWSGSRRPRRPWRPRAAAGCPRRRPCRRPASVALDDDDAALPPDDGDLGAARGAVGDLPDEGAAPVPLHGKASARRAAGRCRSASATVTAMPVFSASPSIGELGLQAQRARRLVDAVVDAGDASRRTREPGSALRGRRDRLALRDARRPSAPAPRSRRAAWRGRRAW